MNELSLIQMLGKLVVMISLLLAFFLFTVKSHHRLANRFFASFLVLTAVDLSGFFIYPSILSFPVLETFRLSAAFLQMPVYWLYFSAFCFTDFKLRPQHALHALPFLLFNIVFSLPLALALPGSEPAHARVLFQIIGELQFVSYIAACFLVLRKYKAIYRENYTNAALSIHKWLFQILLLSCIAHSIVVIKNFLGYHDNMSLYLSANVLVALIALGVMCWFMLSALYHPDLFRGVDSQLALTKENSIEQKNKTHASTTTNEADPQVQSQIAFLQRYMRDSEIFLDASLSIQQLAEKIDMPVKDLSILINHEMGQHFFDFINEYRIQKAMEFLRDPTRNEQSVLEILYEVGFNSKSSFNTWFKKISYLTPTEYRKKHS